MSSGHLALGPGGRLVDAAAVVEPLVALVQVQGRRPVRGAAAGGTGRA